MGKPTEVFSTPRRLLSAAMHVPHPITLRISSRRLPVLLLLVLGAAFAMAACRDEPEPTATQPSPTATLTVVPTPPPTATPTPATATPTTETAQPAASMRDFVIDASSTGKDLIDRLSEEEAACIRQAYGDAIFQFILDSPMLVQGGGDSAMAAPMFACIADENMAHLTAAFLAMLTGAESGESRECFADVVMENPGIAQASIGIELDGYETDHMSRQEFRVSGPGVGRDSRVGARK